MPAVRTIVSDLYHNRATAMHGVAWAYNNGFDETARLDGHRRVRQLAAAVSIAYNGGGGQSVFTVARSPLGNANGFVLGYEDEHSTLVTLTRNHRINVSGEYSGCLYSVYDVGNGAYKCVHTARPAGHYAEAYVQALRQYATREGWNLVYEIPSRNDANSGVGMNGCVGTLFVTRISYTIAPAPVVRTVRLRLDNMGNSVYRSRWTKPTGGPVVIDNP